VFDIFCKRKSYWEHSVKEERTWDFFLFQVKLMHLTAYFLFVCLKTFEEWQFALPTLI